MKKPNHILGTNKGNQSATRTSDQSANQERRKKKGGGGGGSSQLSRGFFHPCTQSTQFRLIFTIFRRFIHIHHIQPTQLPSLFHLHTKKKIKGF